MPSPHGRLRFAQNAASRCRLTVCARIAGTTWAESLSSLPNLEQAYILSKTAFLFPGQGAQYLGMGAALIESSEAARRLFDRASGVLGYDLARICTTGPAEKLDSTAYSQPALYVTSLAALEQLKADRPDVIASCQGAAGLSLGEYTAWTFAGVMDFETGLRVVQKRGEAMQAASEQSPSGMVSVLGLDADRVQAVCEQSRHEGEVLQIANYLCPGNIAVSGSQDACDRVAAAAVAAGAMTTVSLAVAGAFHTPLMQSAVSQLSDALASAKLERPTISVYSNVDAGPHEEPDEIRQLLTEQVVQPVQWEATMQRMIADGFLQFFEIGPGRVLRGLLKRLNRKIPCENIAG